ncbi:MAG: cytochrome c biogenesis protein CcsA [Betaproteobacteria bacterium]
MIVAQLAVALVYAWLAWVDRPGADSAAAGAQSRVRQWTLALTVVAHFAVAWLLVFQPSGVNLSFAVSLSLISLLLAAWLAVSTLLLPVPGMTYRTLPIAAVAATLPVLLPTPHWLPYSTDLVAAAHLVVALLAFALFVIAAIQAAAMLALEQDLHRGVAQTSTTIPPVLTLERWLFGLIAIGFLLLTAALASGVIFSEYLFGKAVKFSHKTFFSVLAWVLFGVLLLGRWRLGWRGRKALRWVVIGSLLLLIGYAGSKFVLEVVLGRS